ncbi:MAG: twin-arginine translocase subunit TatC [Leptospiraceae bacterium]|nr:twin-arginine translocase subunit TatC [Leptospiraceae bacterium]MDW8307302.1 twin-arginine translocase subunit TatC [Leptospiraceae bacterium]
MPEDREDPDAYIARLRREQGYMPFVDHLEELRQRIIRILLWVLGFAAVSWFFYAQVFQFVLGPVSHLLSLEQNKLTVKIIATRLFDFFAVEMKISLLTGFILAVPPVLFEIWGFVVPALDKKVRSYGNGILVGAILLFWAGVFFCRQYVWGVMVEFLALGWAPPPIELPNGQTVRTELHLTLNEYLSFFFSFHILFGLAFELPIISLILGMSGVLTTDFFRKYWRHSVVVIAIISGVVTPTDGFSMIAMMVPLVVLFFLSWGLVSLVEKKMRS